MKNGIAMNHVLIRWLLLAIFVISLLLQFFLCKLLRRWRRWFTLLYPILLLILIFWSIMSLLNPTLPYPDIIRQVGFFDFPDSVYGLLFIGSAFLGYVFGSIIFKFSDWLGGKNIK